MNLPFFIARRYFFSVRNTSSVNIITAISVVGYAVGSFALIVLLSALNGFERMIFKVYENYYPDIKVTPASGKVIPFDTAMMMKISGIRGIRAVAPVLEENAVLQYNDNQAVALVKGVGPEWLKVVKKDSIIAAGKAELNTDNGAALAWMAEGLIYRLAIGRESSQISVLAPRRESVGVAQMDMNEDVIHVGAMVRAGEEMNQKLLVVPRPWAESLFEREQEISAYEIAVNNPDDLADVCSDLRSVFGNGYVVKDRYQQNEAIYKMFNTEKWVAFSIMAFVMLLISFNLVGSLSMLVLEKKNDIRLLSHLGMYTSGIRGIYFREGLIVALTGTLAGLLLGVAAVMLQQEYGFITTRSTFAAIYPVQLRTGDILLILALSGGLGVSSAIYPALKSVRST